MRLTLGDSREAQVAVRQGPRLWMLHRGAAPHEAQQRHREESHKDPEHSGPNHPPPQRRLGLEVDLQVGGGVGVGVGLRVRVGR